jgi:hypothetical protein
MEDGEAIMVDNARWLVFFSVMQTALMLGLNLDLWKAKSAQVPHRSLGKSRRGR